MMSSFSYQFYLSKTLKNKEEYVTQLLRDQDLKDLDYTLFYSLIAGSFISILSPKLKIITCMYYSNLIGNLMYYCHPDLSSKLKLLK